MLTQDFIRSILHYDADTGIFTWKDSRHNRVKVGSVAGTVGTDGYCRIRVAGNRCKGHRLVWLYVYGRWPKDAIDHINMNKSDNRLCNLREVVSQQNCMNRGRRSDNTSGYKGVTLHNRHVHKKWMARICTGGKRRTIGYFTTPEEAHDAYAKEAQRLHGEFANLGQ